MPGREHRTGNNWHAPRGRHVGQGWPDYGKLKLKDDGTIDGLDLDTLKKNEPYLFEAIETNIIGGGDPGGGNEPPEEGEPPKDYAGYKKWREKHQ